MSSDAPYRLLRAAQGNAVDDRRKRTGRTNAKRTRPNIVPKPSKWERRKIIAWDGEGANLDSGEHVYNLLANSYGKFIINHQGLSTEECFRFFLAASDRQAINVIYGGSYDVNMILRDVTHENIKRLWKTGRCYWQNYSIHYAHRKKFTIHEFHRDYDRRKPVRSFILWDVLGYFQSTFVKACRKWLGEDFAGQLKVFDDIQVMKEQRSTFTTEKIDEIIKYNYVECKMLVILVEALFKAMDEADIVLQRYDGAGSIAAALLRKNNIISHQGDMPREVQEWTQYAYAGGRIEAVKVGNTEVGSIYRYDINSAYPSACLDLPSFAGATWSFDAEWNGSPYSIVDVEWELPSGSPFYPLFYRRQDGCILFPRVGRGRYYGYEIQTLCDFYNEGADFQIIQSCNIHLALDTKPFNFLQGAYATRRQFKDRGSMAHEAIKLGMNSVYGKLAQQAGYRNGRIPTYHNLYWAGLITSATRSKMFRAAMQAPTHTIAFATDAVITSLQLELQCGNGLGEWTPEEYTGITIVQAGVYWLGKDGEWSDKYRGFDAGSLKREEILDCWANHKTYTARLTRFCGMGSAVGTNNFKDWWRVWRTDGRKLNIYPAGKRSILDSSDNFHLHLCSTNPTGNYSGDLESHYYPLEWGLGSGTGPELRRDSDGQDMRIVEEEMMDSYA